VCICRLLGVSILCEHQTKVVFDQKLIVGWGEHKVAFDKSGFRIYYVEVDLGLNFPSVLLLRA